MGRRVIRSYIIILRRAVHRCLASVGVASIISSVVASSPVIFYYLISRRGATLDLLSSYYWIAYRPWLTYHIVSSVDIISIDLTSIDILPVSSSFVS